MHEQYFGFSQRPFSICPQLEDFFPGQSHQQTVSAAAACIQRRNGPVIIIGNVGSGKSLTLQVIGRKYSDQFTIVSIECSRLEQRSELLQSILFGLEMPFRDLSEGELRLSLIDYLKNDQSCENGILLLVDEADRLSIELLDELRLITNVVKHGRPQVQLVLAGTQRLEESLNDPRLASFNQRVASRSYLQSLSRTEVESYIADHIERAGGKIDTTFDDAAIEEIAKASDGCPRLINQLCENSLTAAAAERLDGVSFDVVQKAWAELQNLPMPATSSPLDFDQNTDSAGNGNGGSMESVVEFGSLDDDPVSAFGSDDHQSDVNETAAEVHDNGSAEAIDDDDDRVSVVGESDHGIEFGSENETDDDDVAANDVLETAAHSSIDFEQSRLVDRDDYKDSDESSFEDDDAAGWDGRLPTNLGVRPDALGALGSADELPFSSAYDSSVDPFAPQEDSTSDQQFRMQEIRDAHRHSGEGEEFSDAAESYTDSQPSSADDETPAPEKEMAESVSDSDPRIETLKREQEELLKKVFSIPQSPALDSQFDSPTDPNRPSTQADADLSFEAEADVQAAFEGLEMIDEARSRSDYAAADAAPAGATEPTGPAEPALPADDPFAEDFEEEVMIHDAYSPFVAQQNQSSLSVTTDNLSHLVPIDEQDSLDPAELSQSMQPMEPIEPSNSIDSIDSSDSNEPSDLEESSYQDDAITTSDADDPSEVTVDAASIDDDQSDGPDSFVSAEEYSSSDQTMDRATDADQNETIDPVASEFSEELSTNNSAQNQAFLDDLVDMPKTEGRFTFTVPPADAEFVPVQSVPSEWSEELVESNANDDTLDAETESAIDAEIDADLVALTQDFPFEDDTSEIGGQNLTAYADGPSIDESADDLGDAPMPENYLADDGLDSSSAPVPPIAHVAPTDTLGTAFAGTHDAASEIRGQADDIIKRLREEQAQPFPSSQEAQSYQSPQGSHDPSETTGLANEDDQTHQVLRELMAQQQYARQAQNPPQADSTSVEYPITEHEDYHAGGDQTDRQNAANGTNATDGPNAQGVQDDRDMLRVNVTQFAQPPAQPSLPPTPLTDATPSTGEAQRMDYGQLFDQLRNLPKQ